MREMSTGRSLRRQDVEARAKLDIVVIQAGDYISVRFPFVSMYADQTEVRGRVCEIGTDPAGNYTMTLEGRSDELVSIFDGCDITVFLYNDDFKLLKQVTHIQEKNMKISKIHGGVERLRRRRLRKTTTSWNEALAQKRKEHPSWKNLVQEDHKMPGSDTESDSSSGDDFFRRDVPSESAVRHSVQAEQRMRKKKPDKSRHTPSKHEGLRKAKEGSRKSPRKRTVSMVNDTIISIHSTIMGTAWARDAFGKYTQHSFCTCTAMPARNRDASPQYAYIVRAFKLRPSAGSTEGIIWLTDVQQRDGRTLWTSHGKRRDAHYTMQNNIIVEILKRSYVRVSANPNKFRVDISHLTTKAGIQNALNGAVMRLTNLRCAGPKWKQNSCHLDSFLLSELAFYSAHEENIPHDIASFPEVIQRLLRVLVTLGICGYSTMLEQDIFRDDYRSYELSQLTMVARTAMEETHGTGDYAWHGHMVNALAKREGTVSSQYVQQERMLGIGVKETCSHHSSYHVGPIEPKTKFFSFVQASVHWFPRPDGVSQLRMSPEDFRSSTGGVKHDGIEDNILSNLLRPVGEETPCDENDACQKLKAQVTYTKMPSMCRLPRSLEIDSGLNEAFSNTRIKFKLQLGTRTYHLISIVLESPAHFTVVVKLGTGWWHYDDLHTETYVDRTRGLPTLIALKGEDGVTKELKAKAMANPAFLPRIWRYALDPSAHPQENNIVSSGKYDTIGFMDPVLHGASVIDQTLLRLQF